MYRNLAKIAQKYVSKGNQLYVSGKMQTRKYTDKSGQDRYTTEIIANDIKMLGNRQESRQDQVKNEQPAKRIRINIQGELSILITKIMERRANYKVRCLNLIVDESGQPVTLRTLQGHFYRARKAAGINLLHSSFVIYVVRLVQTRRNQAEISGRLKSSLGTQI